MGLSCYTYYLSHAIYFLALNFLSLLIYYIAINIYGFYVGYIFSFIFFAFTAVVFAFCVASFWTDHKLALDFVTLMYVFGAFLALMADDNDKNWMFVIGVMMPNSAFAIGLKTENSGKMVLYSFIAFSLNLVYLGIFALIQFPNESKAFLKSHFTVLKRTLKKTP